MNYYITQKSQKYLYIIIVIIVIIGVFFRVFNLETKVYWHDEVFTTLHINGYGWKDWKTSIFTNQIIGVDALQYYLNINPDKTLYDTLKVLAIDDPHHPPLYYILVRYWRQFFGDSITIIRSFSAFFSLLMLPAIYWLSWELFGLTLVSIIAVGLVAISPLHILYSQEAREYALWSVFIILSNSSLLRAIKLTQNHHNLPKKSYSLWGLYSLLTALSLYISFFTIFVIIAQVVYLIFRENFRLTKPVFLQGIALSLSLITFMPWILVFIANYEQYKLITSWTKEIHLNPLTLFRNWALNLSRIFFDINGDLTDLLIYIVVLLSILLVIYALYFLWKNTPKKCWGLIFSLIVTQLLFLFIPDLFWGGVRSLSLRYLLPSVIAIDLAVAYLLAIQLTKNPPNLIKIWSIITAIILTSGVISCTISSQADSWWNKVISVGLPQVSRIINSTDNPLLISNNQSYHPGNIMALSYLLKPDVKLQLLSAENNYQLPENFSHIFLLSPSDKLRTNLDKKEGIKVAKVFSDFHLQLWKVEFNSQSSITR